MTPLDTIMSGLCLGLLGGAVAFWLLRRAAHREQQVEAAKLSRNAREAALRQAERVAEMRDVAASRADTDPTGDRAQTVIYVHQGRKPNRNPNDPQE